MNLQTFVTVHDADIVRRCEEEERFGTLGERHYLFVGQRPVANDVPAVIPRRLIDNVEYLPHFYDFTGWWALARHRLIVRPHVMLLQYDMHVASSTLEADVDALLEAGPGPVAFTAGHFDAGNFLLMLGGFEDAYRQGMAAVGADMDRWAPFNEWPTTQGIAWRTDEFYDYMMWFRPLFDVWRDNVWAGHLAERTVKAWCAERGVEPRYLIGAIAHEAKDCHGTGALMAGNMAVYEERVRTFATSTMIATRPVGQCPDCGARTRSFTLLQPALFIDCGYGAARQTRVRWCPCGWRLEVERSEVRPPRDEAPT